MTNSVSIHSQSQWNKLNYPTWLTQKLSVPPKNAVLRPTEGQCSSRLHFRELLGVKQSYRAAGSSDCSRSQTSIILQSSTIQNSLTHLMDLDPIAFEFIVPSCVSINVINAINELNLERERGKIINMQKPIDDTTKHIFRLKFLSQICQFDDVKLQKQHLRLPSCLMLKFYMVNSFCTTEFCT